MRLLDKFPDKALFNNFFSSEILNKLGVKSMEELIFEKGSFKILTPITNLECFSEIDNDLPKNLKMVNDLPIGGIGIISLKTISEVEGRGPKGKSPFPSSGFDAGHILSEFNCKIRGKVNLSYR